jgi:hypothetical protein
MRRAGLRAAREMSAATVQRRNPASAAGSPVISPGVPRSGQVSQHLGQHAHLRRGVRGRGQPVEDHVQPQLVTLAAEPAREGESWHLA